LTTINWFQSNRIYALLQQQVMKKKQQDYYEGKLTPEEEAEMLAFLELYIDNEYSPEELE
tara:strand:+ start:7568 stop:7747 length:180 start_codon:yes stop_codon:yes gene_type:complete